MLEIRLDFAEITTDKEALEKNFLEPLYAFVDRANGGLGEIGFINAENLALGETAAGHMDDDNEDVNSIGHNTSFRFWGNGTAVLDLNLDSNDPTKTYRFEGTWEQIATKMIEEVQRRIEREKKKYEQLEKMATAARVLLE